ncbi:hypothetical protein AB0J67_33735, partial [Catellatospora sp. NPDC049609]
RKELAAKRDPQVPDAPTHASRVKAKYGDRVPTRTVVAADAGASCMPSSRRPAVSFSCTHTSMSGSSARSVSGSVSVHTSIRYFIVSAP